MVNARSPSHATHASPRTARETASAERPRPAAPAVAIAFRILEYLARQSRGAGVSEIARAVSVGKSTCFNVLGTLLAEGAVVKDLRRAEWRLGPTLVQLGTAARRGYDAREVLRAHVQKLVDEAGVGAVVGQVLADHRGVVVIDRVIPRVAARGEVRLPPIGDVFPLTAPVLGRTVLAQYDDDEALAIARSGGGFGTAATRRTLLDRLAQVRSRGYAESRGEYEPDVNAVGCALDRAAGVDGLILCLVGHRKQLPADRIDDRGRALLRLADAVRQELA